MNNAVMFESAGDERGTPQDFFDKLNAEFHFDVDCAASPLNHKCELYFGFGGMADDALEADWGGEGTTCFLNPPYSTAGAFVQKAREEADKGAIVVMLLPVRSDTKWWHKYVWDHTEYFGKTLIPLSNNIRTQPPNGNWRPGVIVRFLPGRLNFELSVPADMRTFIRSEVIAADEIGDGERKEKIAQLVKTTGLPRMAIERIWQDQPDDCLLDSAPFPSCVVIFSKP